MNFADRRQRFRNLTGLHPHYFGGRELPDDEVIAIQARKIKGLELSLNQQRKGYLRKVARLERQIAELRASMQKGDE